MRTTLLLPACLLFALLLAPAGPARASGEEEEKPGPNGASAPALPGFVHVPAGKVVPGATAEDIKGRALNEQLRLAIQYDQWGSIPHVTLREFLMQRYELTNAQWKLYLDREFRETHTTGEQETLRSIAANHIRFRDQPEEEEWRAIYAFNWETIVEALEKAGKWKEGWSPDSPGDEPGSNDDLGSVILPEGLELHFYRHRTPRPWYGWCRLAHLQAGKEYCDITKAPAEAFLVPETEMFRNARLRATDFAAMPVRDAAPNEFLAFAEWAGCHLPSEYEWERAARGDRPNSQQFTGTGEWDHGTETDILASVQNTNPEVRMGPLPVDAETVRKSDSPFGVRHMLGNAWELTRTFWNFHPRVTPQPPPPSHGLFNYALVAKGASWGDTWRAVQISTRTGLFGMNSPLDLQYNNRVDTLGTRLVRHPRPGEDLLRHSILALSYNRGRGLWGEPLPHEYAIARMAGADEIHIVESESPYTHIQDRARGIAFAPLHLTKLDKKRRTFIDRAWQAEHEMSKREFEVLGVLRSDFPLMAGVRLNGKEARALREQREEYERIKKEIEKRNRSARGRKEQKENPLELPPEPPAVSAYEEATRANEEMAGLWVEKVIEPGEWLVVYWGGFIGLADRSRVMPPTAILMIDDPRKDFDDRMVNAERDPLLPTTLTLEPEEDRFTLKGSLEIDPNDRRAREAPGSQESPIWALAQTMERGWPGRAEAKYCWDFEITVRTAEGALRDVNWTK